MSQPKIVAANFRNRISMQPMEKLCHGVPPFPMSHFDIIAKQRSVSHCGLAIYIKKYLNAKEELWKLLKYFIMPNIQS
jgi:hypothetical protein